MGGKSRKSGGVSKRLIDRLKGNSSGTGSSQSREKGESRLPGLFNTGEENARTGDGVQDVPEPDEDEEDDS